MYIYKGTVVITAKRYMNIVCAQVTGFSEAVGVDC